MSSDFEKITQHLENTGVDINTYSQYLQQFLRAKSPHKLVSPDSTPTLEESSIDFEVHSDDVSAEELSFFSPKKTHEEEFTEENFFLSKESTVELLEKQKQIKLFETIKLAPEETDADTEKQDSTQQSREKTFLERVSPPSQNILNWSEFQKTGLLLLLRSKIEVEELNELIQSLPEDKLQSRMLLQLLLKKKKIRLDECFEFEQAFPEGILENQRCPFWFRDKQNRPEFFLTEERWKKKYGHYLVVAELARGGMGIVYKAYHPGLKQHFALKVLIAGENASEEAIRRFHREVKNTASLKHPGIIQIVDSGQEGGEHYFAMEYVEGQTLNVLIKKHFPIREGLILFRKILESLHYAHNQGIIHRDIKPENIFVTKDGEPKIGDFGLAKNRLIDSKTLKLTHTGAVLGTPAYMSPEQASGQIEQLDEKTDIYSISVCIYYLLTKHRPFEADSFHNQIYKILNEEPSPPSKWNRDIHKDLDTIVLKAMEKNKNNRYASAQEFADDLGRFLSGYPILARPSTSRERFLKWAKRNQAPFRVGAILSIFFIAVVVYFQWQKYQTQQKKQYELNTQFQSALFEAELAIQKSKEEDPEKELSYHKMDHLITALNSLNHALFLKPQEAETMRKKMQVVEELTQLAVQAEEDLFANYLLYESRRFAEYFPEENQNLEEWIESEKIKRQDFQLREFLRLTNQLRIETSTAEFREEVVFSVARMTAPEVFERLLNFLQEGTAFFLENRNRDARSVEFYETMVKALGRTRNPNAFEALKKSLELLASKLLLIKNEAERPFTDLRYLILIAQAFANIPATETAHLLQKWRQQFGENSAFWKHTEEAYHKARQYRLSEEVLEENPAPSQVKNKAVVPQKLLEKGLLYLDAKQYLEALQQFSLAIQEHSEHAESYYYSGLCRSYLGQYVEAIQDYTKAIFYRSDYVSAYNSRGLAYNSISEFDAALKDFDQAITLEATFDSAYNNRGLVYTNLNQFEKAIDNFNEAIRLNKKHVQAYHNRSFAFRALGQFDLALQDLNYAIELDPQNALFYRNRAVFFLEQKKYPSGIQDLTKTIQLVPEDVMAYVYRGQAKAKLSQWNGAIQDYEAAIQIQPNLPIAYYQKGSALQELGRLSDAIETLKIGLRLEANSEAMLYCCRLLLRRSQEYIQDEKFALALQDLDFVLQEVPPQVNEYQQAKKLQELAQKKQKK